jgi:hypothetical protein
MALPVEVSGLVSKFGFKAGIFANKQLWIGIAVLVILGIVIFVIFKQINFNRKFKFKVDLFYKRADNHFVEVQKRGAILFDERGIEKFVVAVGPRSYLEVRQIPPQELVSTDNRVAVAQVGAKECVFLKRVLDLSEERFSLTPIDPHIKYATLYELKRAHIAFNLTDKKQQFMQAVPFILFAVLVIGFIVMVFYVTKQMNPSIALDAANVNSATTERLAQIVAQVSKCVG